MLGCSVVLLGAAALLGRLFDSAFLIAPWAGPTTMKASTATAFVLAGAALCLEPKAASDPRLRSVALGLAALTALIGALALIEHAFAVDLGIDWFLFSHRDEVGTPPSPGRMAPNTAASLVLIGAALALGRSRLVQPLALVVLFDALIGLVGYAYDVHALYSVGSASMALQTALAFAALALGVLACRSEHGIGALLVEDTLTGMALRRLLPVLVLVPFGAGWLRLEGERLGWFDPDFGFALLIAVCTTVLCAVAIWNARRQAASESTLAQTTRDQYFSFQLSEVLRAAGEPMDLLYAVAQALGEHLGATRVLFIEVDAAADRMIWHRDYRKGLPSVAGEQPLSKFSGGAQEQARSGVALVSADTSTDPTTASLYESTYQPLALRARILAPLFRAGRWAGGLLVGDSQPRAWQQREVRLVEQVAERTWAWFEHLRTVEHLRLVLESSPIGKLSVDQRGRIVYANRRIEQLFGYGHGSLIGQSVDTLVPRATRVQHELLRNGFLSQPQARPMGAGRKLHAVRKDGSELAVEIALTPVRAAGGDQVLVSVMDATEQERAEVERERLLDQLKGLNVELEQRVQARTEELTRSLAEREVLLQEIHHRVKNNLQIISSLINLQARKLEPGAGRFALDECAGRVASISLIHELLYQAKDYGQVPFCEYARRLATNVFRAHGAPNARVGLTLDVDAIALAVHRAIPCGLILNELIANALKHAFPNERAGQIQVALKMNGPSSLRMAVSDDGVGMPIDVDAHRSQSLGMQLVATLAEQLDAKLEIVRDHGTTVCIELPTEGPA
jgi:PAS domain S-box-containing protein